MFIYKRILNYKYRMYIVCILYTEIYIIVKYIYTHIHTYLMYIEYMVHYSTKSREE